MDIKQLIGAIFAMIFRIIVAVAVIVIVFRLAVQSYDFGFRIFAEQPVAEGTGRTVSVSILDGKSAMEIGEMLQEKGLIKDAKVFYVQERLSNYHNQIQPGTYELNTAMSIEEMLAVMASDEEQTDNTLDGNSDSADVLDSETSTEMTTEETESTQPSEEQ